MRSVVNKIVVVFTLLAMLHSIVGLQLSFHRCPHSGDYHYDVELITGLDRTTLHLDVAADHVGYMSDGCPHDCNKGEKVSVRYLDQASLTERPMNVGDEGVASCALPYEAGVAALGDAAELVLPVEERGGRLHVPKQSVQQLLCVMRC